MNRKIKFKYRFDYDIVGIKSEIITIKQLEAGYLNWLHLPGQLVKLLSRDQYTGYNDKNDKEIFGNDIVKSKFYYGNDFGQRVGKVEEKIFLIKWIFNETSQYSGFSFYPCYDFKDIEKIGNIYDNPELLEGI